MRRGHASGRLGDRAKSLMALLDAETPDPALVRQKYDALSKIAGSKAGILNSLLPGYWEKLQEVLRPKPTNAEDTQQPTAPASPHNNKRGGRRRSALRTA
jgi:hypothetical protein